MQMDRSERFRKWLQGRGGADIATRGVRLELDRDIKIGSYADLQLLLEQDSNFPPMMLALLEWLWNEFCRAEPFYNWD